MRKGINDLGRRQILAAATRALQRVDAVGTVPTPLDDVGEAAGVEAVIDIGQLPEELIVNKPSALKKLLGAYLFRAETAFVDFTQSKGRARFTWAHELGHRVLPWHETAYVLDDERRLFRETEELLELEANLAGAHLIFQGPHFFERALDYETSLKTPLLLAEVFDASCAATIRYYVEHHSDTLAVLVAGRYKRADGTVPIFHALESSSFRERLGPIAGHFPTQSLPVNETHPLGPLLVEDLAAIDPPSKEVKILDLGNQYRRSWPRRSSTDTATSLCLRQPGDCASDAGSRSRASNVRAGHCDADGPHDSVSAPAASSRLRYFLTVL